MIYTILYVIFGARIRDDAEEEDFDMKCQWTFSARVHGLQGLFGV